MHIHSSIQRCIQDTSSALMLTHKRVDADGVGAMLAMKLAFPNRNWVPFIPEPLPRPLSVLPGADCIKHDTQELQQQYDTIFIFDCSEWRRTGIDERVASYSKRVVFIDHHALPEHRHEKALFCSTTIDKAASTTVVVYNILKKLGRTIDRHISTNLLAGIVTDTGGFAHTNTTPELLQITAELMRAGAQITKIVKKATPVQPMNVLKLWGRALQRVRHNPDLEMSYVCITRGDLVACSATAKDASGIANMMSATTESKYVLVLTECENDTIKASLRSESHHNVDVEKIAKQFGGGGHKLAAGFEIKGQIKENDGEWHIV